MSNWYKLDNAAKIFPPTTNYYDAKVFRFSCLLKDSVDVLSLEEALNKTLEDFPIFKSVLKKGLFWYYLEISNIKPVVRIESNSPCEKLNTSLLFELTYYKNKINLEVNHVLSDGTGCITFFRTLIYNYLNIKYKLKLDVSITDSSNYEKEADSFNKYYKPDKKIKLPKSKNAYKLKGNWYNEGKIRIITGSISTSKLKDMAKKYNTTITVLLVALLIKSINDIQKVKDKRKPIVVSIPVDLRNFYESNTVRNFFNVTNVDWSYTSEALEDIINEVDKKLKASLDKEVINRRMNNNIALENFIFIRLIPLPIKNIVLKYSYKYLRKKHTITLSNVGIIDLPQEMQKYVEEFLVMNSTDEATVCVCSYLDKLDISFCTHFVNSEIEKNYFRYLKDLGLDVAVYVNDLGGNIDE